MGEKVCALGQDLTGFGGRYVLVQFCANETGSILVALYENLSGLRCQPNQPET